MNALGTFQHRLQVKSLRYFPMVLRRRLFSREPQLPTQHQDEIEEINIMSQDLHPAQAIALHQVAPHVGDPLDTALNRLRPERATYG